MPLCLFFVRKALPPQLRADRMYKELGQLDNLKEVRPPKDYSKQLNPRRLDANKKASAEA